MGTLDEAIEVIGRNEKYDKNSLVNAIRERIRDEYLAIEQYEGMLPHMDDYKLKDRIQHLADEEKLHVGELEAMLYDLSPEDQKRAKKGMKEVHEELG